MTDRQTGGVGADVDLKPTTVPVFNRQTGAVGADVDIMPPAPVFNRQTGMLGIMVDGAVSVAVATLTWTSSAFQIGGAYPLANWLTNHFVSSGGAAVTWDSTNKKFVLA